VSSTTPSTLPRGGLPQPRENPGAAAHGGTEQEAAGSPGSHG
jgi:hypothetical protein